MDRPPPPDPALALATAESLLQRTAEAMARLLRELAAALDPFPPFMGMKTIQAVEVEVPQPGRDRGCVVVTPEGRLCELDIRLIPGLPETGGVDQVEEFRELDMPPDELLYYTYHAVRLLARLLEERRARPA